MVCLTSCAQKAAPVPLLNLHATRTLAAKFSCGLDVAATSPRFVHTNPGIALSEKRHSTVTPD
jgi:hypothetical protein